MSAAPHDRTPPFSGSDADLVRGSLEKICRSTQFARAERLQQFLRFIVEAKLKDHWGGLKETVIGIRIYLRPPDYDPKAEPIVRNEARRLRLKLDEYYRTGGQEDSVIITVPKGGYLPHFEIRPKVVLLPVPAELHKSRLRRTVGRGAILALLLVGTSALVLLFAYALPSRDGSLRPERPKPLTRYAGEEFDGSLSPDGRQVAFVWNSAGGNFDIYVRPVLSGTAKRLTDNPAHDIHPAWSPDGKQIAFLRMTRESKDVFVIPAIGGPERWICRLESSNPQWVPDASLISAFSDGPTWSANGRHLAITDHSGGAQSDSIHSVDLQTKKKQQLTFPEPQTGDYFPVFSPGGRQLAFVRKADQPGRGGLYVQPVNGSGGARLIASNLGVVSGLTWLSEDRLVFSADQTGGAMLWAVSASGGPLQVIAGNERNASQPNASRNGHQLVYTTSFRNTDVWRAPLHTGKEEAAPASKVITSSGMDHSAQYSPDGQEIIFVSDRSGTPEIWKSKSDGSELLQLTEAKGTPIGSPHWSPDGRDLVYDSVKDGLSAIYTMRSDGTQSRLFASARQDYMMPTWSRDGRTVYFTSQARANSRSTFAICKKAIGSDKVVTLAQGRGDVLESFDGRTLYFSPNGSEAAIWQMPVNGGDAAPVPELEGVDASRYCALGRSGIYFLSSQSAPWTLALYSFKTHQITSVAIMNSMPEFGTPSLSVSPDEHTIIYSQLNQSGSDLMLLEWQH